MNWSEKPPLPPVAFAVSGAVDAHPPRRIARLVEDVGVRKAQMAFAPLFMLALLGGIFVGFGAMVHTLVLSDPGSATGFARLLAGLALAAGYAMAMLAGTEIFAGGILVVMAWADGRVSGAQLRRYWFVVFLGNLMGGIVAAWAADIAGLQLVGDGAVGRVAVEIAEARVALGFWPSTMRGVLCGLMLCAAAWLCLASQNLTDRMLAVFLPLGLCAALGFEHVAAEMYLVPAGMMQGAAGVTVEAFLRTLVPVTLGNLIAGGALVGLVYWIVYVMRWGGGPGEDR